ncbi:hypothetical protein BTO30_05945 [Domibacillus antri]|uniref:AbrB family transcriptional regulator n=1 Tax=Domibacillus antri TaxID=1714264 RepID=A0A1Q8Q828_9BACI|nr:AbrB family transcriptional regulator [Domibacillus antri]OLN23499.1 hypothetical protein BTO30_05945 [Domibacillus antri]
MKKRTIKTIGVGAAAGGLFDALDIILPWMLGPLLVIMVLNQWTPVKLTLPSFWRNAGLLFLGISLGTSFTTESIEPAVRFFPYLAVLTIAITALTIGMAHLFSQKTGVDTGTAVLGSLPGGLSQMVLIADEHPNVDASVVTVMQTLRLFMVVTTVPFLVSAIHRDHAASVIPANALPAHHLSFGEWIFIAGIVAAGIFLFKQGKLPTPYLLGPMCAVIVWNLTGGSPFHLPYWIIAASQVVLGVYIGLKMNITGKTVPLRQLGLLFAMNGILVAFCLAAAVVIHHWTGFPYLDLFIGLAPGGVAEMAVTAMSTGADIAAVTSFHLFRVFFILFIAAPLTARWLKKRRNDTNLGVSPPSG